MEALLIAGGKPLQGTVTISGAKNAALPILAATVIHGGQYVLENCPDITDVTLASEILRTLGARVHRTGNTLLVDTELLNGWIIPAELMKKMRASVLFLGALLARCGKAVLALPGGCPLGQRPIDLHLDVMTRMGASVTLQEDTVRCEAPVLHGGHLTLRVPSVGATENAMLAATACRGRFVLQNAAREPEIVDLANFLTAMGARVRGAGSGTLIIDGGSELHDARHRIMPDRIETATWLCAAAGCGGQVTLCQTNGSLLQPVLQTLEQAGCRIEQKNDELTLRRQERLCAPRPVETGPYPGFPTDAQALLMAAMLRAKGATKIMEHVFDRRFGHIGQLRRFGAQICMEGDGAVIHGVPVLRPAAAEGGDLRACAALVLAALQAPGESSITGLKHLDRGYDNLEEKLRGLGAEVTRIR